jgi:hypothetical protein
MRAPDIGSPTRYICPMPEKRIWAKADIEAPEEEEEQASPP